MSYGTYLSLYKLYVLILLIVVLPMGTIEEEVSGGSHGGSAFNNITNNGGDGGGGGGNGRTKLKLACTNFLSKLYKMVDNKATNSIISWGSSSNTFIISDEGRFISEILPCYFKINHLDNFIYQLNNYGFKKKEGDHLLEFEHEYFQEGNQLLLKHIKRRNKPLMATNNISTLSVATNELEALFAKVRHSQQQIKTKIHWLKDDIGKTFSEVKSIIEDNSHKLISTFFEGRKRKLVDFNLGTDFVDIEKDFELMYGQCEASMTHIDGFMTLSDLTEKLTKKHNDNNRGSVVGDDRRRIPQFLQKLYDMVQKEETDNFVSWNLPNRDSFIIRDINEFASQVLPMYFTHANFSSFNSQLNIYGFRKISWERHEYANEWFQGGRYDLLVNIKRRGKNPLLTRSTIKFSLTQVEMFKDQLKTIEQEQEKNIICLSNYEEQMKSSVYEFKEKVINMANIVNKMILTSNDNPENIKKPETNIKDKGNRYVWHSNILH
uniref:HSF-type DNA-binding domain-containing protein n=1 Tax=Lactuca sativa TaxID=4236 RepID=A0A9R1XWZ8_LACSA|nr:hypothetical protein LSAT_V11C100048040 [Lactuca sativa]